MRYTLVSPCCCSDTRPSSAGGTRSAPGSARSRPANTAVGSAARPAPHAAASTPAVRRSPLADLARVEARLRSINPVATVCRAEHAAVSASSVLDVGGFDLARTLAMEPDFLSDDGEHVHDASVGSLSLVRAGDVDLE